MTGLHVHTTSGWARLVALRRVARLLRRRARRRRRARGRLRPAEAGLAQQRAAVDAVEVQLACAALERKRADGDRPPASSGSLLLPGSLAAESEA